VVETPHLNNSNRKSLMKFLAVIAILVAGVFVGAWGLMVMVGIIHLEWLTFIPPIGYGLAILLTAVKMAFAMMGQLLVQAVKGITED